MSKYTIEVRDICEEYSEGKNADTIDDIIMNSIDKIFDKFEIFDEAYRKPLCLKILRHYYMREICAETVGLWKFWLNNKMCEIMPFYNQLYKSTLLEFNPLYDVDIETTHTLNKQQNSSSEQTQTVNNEEKTNYSGTSNGIQNGTYNDTNDTNKTLTELYSDTPQGKVRFSEIEDNGFLTSAKQSTDKGTITDTKTDNIINDVTNNSNQENTKTINGQGTFNKEVNSLDDYVERVKGKNGGKNYSELIMDFRNTFLNIDMLIIEELTDLFFKLW